MRYQLLLLLLPFCVTANATERVVKKKRGDIFMRMQSAIPKEEEVKRAKLKGLPVPGVREIFKASSDGGSQESKK